MQAEPMAIGDIVIEQIADLASLSDDDIRAMNTFGNIISAESFPDDPPTPLELTAAGVRAIPGFVAYREFWARDHDGAIAATGEVSWTKTEDNQHLVRAGINVRPDRRGRGLARLLLRLIVDATEAEGRTLVVSTTTDRVTDGEAFARRIGAKAAMRAHTNRLVIADVDRAMVDEWIEQGPPRGTGYSLVTIDGRAPDHLVQQVVDAISIMNTAPRDDLDVEDEVFEVEHIRAWEDALETRGDIVWGLFARHDASDVLVGYTQVSWNPQRPETVFQYGTAVHPDHRGHALGKWLKATMLARVLDERPGVQDIRTGNADSNDAMLGINRELGFEPYIATSTWEVSTSDARAYLESR
jgi:GNAT superfamily N-acetyltransferase